MSNTSWNPAWVTATLPSLATLTSTAAAKLPSLSQLPSSLAKLPSLAKLTPQQRASLLPVLAAGAATYLVLVQALRHRHLDLLHDKFPYGPGRAKPFSAMTEEDAQQIILWVTQWEMPAMAEIGLEVALVRTYGIPSISRLLFATRQLGARENVGKRYADTAALVGEIYANAPGSKRGAEAYGRLNYLHGVYIKAGKISNDDMLYVLALFMNSPVEHIGRFEWRPLTDVERCAYGVFHYGMGRAMEIDFSPLPSGPSGFRDGLHFYDEFDAWAKDYEVRCMVPDRSNYEVMMHTLRLFEAGQLPFLRPAVNGAFRAIFDDRLREALMLEAPTEGDRRLVERVFGIKRFVCRNLLLPRTKPFPRFVERSVDGDGRRRFTFYKTDPIYVMPTLWNRWGPGAWKSWALGRPLPGDKGMFPEGFVLKDVGPTMSAGKGWDEAEATVQKLMNEGRKGGCPFA